MRAAISLVVVLALSACATSSGVQKLGPDTYVVSSQVMFGPGKASSARAAALNEAQQFCANLGRELLVDDYSTKGNAMTVTGDSEVRFKCLPQDDAALKRPTYKPAPSIVIEDGRKQ
jgi:putative hemolysin